MIEKVNCGQRKSRNYLDFIHHVRSYLITGTHQRQSTKNERRSVLKAVSRSQYKVDGKYTLFTI